MAPCIKYANEYEYENTPLPHTKYMSIRQKTCHY